MSAIEFIKLVSLLKKYKHTLHHLTNTDPKTLELYRYAQTIIENIEENNI